MGRCIEQPRSDNLLEYLGMEVTNLSTGYNALTQSPVSATPTTQSYFHRPFDVASATSTSDHVNGVKWYQDGDQVLSDLRPELRYS